jgi:transmembrane sensor
LRKVPLKDRSVAAVNTDSQIDVDMTTRLRHVRLVKGEVWFEVAKNPDVPFVVSAGDVRVRAVGTAFSVRRHDKGVDVLVTEGVVEAWNVNDKAKRQTLTAGNEAYVPEKIADAVIDVAYRPQDVTRKLAWRDREIILHQESLSDAVAEFNRYNTREIIIADPRLNTAQLVGGFQVDQPESFALAVKVALDVPVDINDQRILIGTPGGHS